MWNPVSKRSTLLDEEVGGIDLLDIRQCRKGAAIHLFKITDNGDLHGCVREGLGKCHHVGIGHRLQLCDPCWAGIFLKAMPVPSRHNARQVPEAEAAPRAPSV